MSLAAGKSRGAGSPPGNDGSKKGLSAGLRNSSYEEGSSNFGLVKLPCHHKGTAVAQI